MAVLKNYYQILNVSPTSTRAQVKFAYRALAKIYHPDKNESSKVSEELFKEVLEAYRVLYDDEQRKKYDLQLRYGLSYTYKSRSPVADRVRYRKYGNSGTGKQNQSKSEEKKTTSFFDKFKIALSFIAAILILFLIANYSEEEYSPKTKAPSPRERDSIQKNQPGMNGSK